MSIQFVGSRSVDDRRRRRLAVNGDGASAESAALDNGIGYGMVSSELVASEAAAPWVPVFEWRIWTYGAMLGLVLIAVSFALARPNAFRPELAPLTNHLLHGSHPVLASLTQAGLWFACAQMAMLIGWYRARCKLDFGGRYRVWTWAAVLFALAAVCSATHAHHLIGEIISRGGWLIWRGETVSWLLPTCIVALPLCLQMDRDVRRGRSTLYTLRVCWLLGLTTAILELFSTELRPFAWFTAARLIVPLFAAATLFLGLWLHARVVAYICPDPPESEDSSATLQLATAWHRLRELAVKLFGLAFCWWPGRKSSADESEAKPKRRTRKAAEGEEAAAPKRKRKAPAKRATKPRTRVKVVEEEEEEEEVEADEDAYQDETDDSAEAYESETASDSENEWEEEEEPIEAPPPPSRSNRTVPPPQPPAANFNKKFTSPAQESSRQEYTSDSDEDDEADEDGNPYRLDDGQTADQMRGLSKRQKRELKQKLREQQRQGRR